jgi:hypothetical protein
MKIYSIFILSSVQERELKERNDTAKDHGRQEAEAVPEKGQLVKKTEAVSEKDVPFCKNFNQISYSIYSFDGQPHDFYRERDFQNELNQAPSLHYM